MKKIILLFMLILPSYVLYSWQTKYPNKFTTVTTENAKSSLDKYFTDFEFGNKKYNLLITDGNDTYNYIKEKIGRYNNIGLLFLPKGKKIICQNQSYGVSVAFFDKEGQVDTFSRRNSINNICTKKNVEQVLILPGRVDMSEIESINVNLNGKVYIDKKNAEKIFK